MPRGKSGFKVISFIVCEDVRREENGKELIIGVYSKNILVNSIPVTLPQLTFRIVVEATKPFREFKLVIIQPNKKRLFEFTGEGHVTSIDDWVHLPLRFNGAEFPDAGTYVVRIALDGIWRKAGEFNVRLPKNDDERRRLGAINK